MKNAIYSACKLFSSSFDIFRLLIVYNLTFILSLIYSNPTFGGEYDLNNKTTQIPFNAVTERLIKDGFSVDEIGKIYSNPKVTLELKGVSLFFVHSESKANYEQFLSNEAISSAAAYIQQHKSELDNAQAIYGVDKTIITAIMLVETRLGTYLGNREVINILSTMSALSDSTQKERLWNFLSEDKRIERDKFDKKSASKSKWAYNELKAFLKYAAREGIDPVEIKGSYAGAMGISQFMPSNALTLAKDGDLDGKVDLFNHADAIHSIANYLKHHGWRPTLNREEAYNVLYKYNHSNPYVETLLKISELLKNNTSI
ncbi:MAG: lytic murein transglycosylase [Desulfamplus sp.]|nr:lytic murein transglycosylase [Desulfamplus sp.]